jgi:dienelactone hydrolase
LAPSKDYTNKGEVVEVSASLKAYVVRPEGTSAASDKVLIVVEDIFGVDSGRTKAICDDMAERLGCIVVLPLLLERLERKCPYCNVLSYYSLALT